MEIYVGGNKINDIVIGSTPINSVWVGANQVWSRSIILPSTGWESTSSTGVDNGYAHYSNAVTINKACSLKFTTTGLTNNSTNNTTYLEINTGSGWPSTTPSPHLWGDGGNEFDVSYGSTKTISFNHGDRVRFNYYIRASNSYVNVTSYVEDAADNSVIDTQIVGTHFWTQSPGGGGD